MTESAVYWAVRNDGEWHHIADDHEDLVEMVGDEVLIGQCEVCGGWIKCGEYDAGSQPVYEEFPERGYCREAMTTLASPERVKCECGASWAVWEVEYKCFDGSREVITRR